MTVANIYGDAPLLTPDDVARRLSVSRSMAYALIKRGPDRGGIRAIYIGRLPRVTEGDWRAYLERRGVVTGGAPSARPGKSEAW